MAQRLSALLFLLAVGSAAATAQFAKTVHYTFPTEGVERISIRVADSLSVGRWAGNVILVRTDVRLSNATEGLFRYLTGEGGRYEVTASREGDVLNVLSVEPERRPIETSVGVLEEEIHVKVLLPEDYDGEGVGPYVLAAEESGR